MIFETLGLIGATLLATIFVILQARSLHRRSRNQMSEIKNAILSHVEETRKIDQTLDTVVAQGVASSEFQRKSAEHHRVLMASMNSQLQKIDTMLKSSATTELTHAPEPVEDLQPKRRSLVSRPSPTDRVVMLEELFRARGNAAHSQSNSHSDDNEYQRETDTYSAPVSPNWMRKQRVSNG
jgi:hypothetical protein